MPETQVCEHMNGGGPSCDVFGKSAADVLILHPSDNVAVATAAIGIAAGAILPNGITARQDVARGHKIAIRDIPAGEGIYKFGHRIALAAFFIRAGDWIHCHNAKMPETNLEEIHFGPLIAIPFKARNTLSESFQGYTRSSGVVGVRNYIAVVATVNCSASVVKAICRHFNSAEPLSSLRQKNIDGVIPITHGSGCAQALGGENHALLNRTIAGTVFHPNVVGALFVELGCEGTTSKTILDCADQLGLKQDFKSQTIGIQDRGGSSAAIGAGIEAISRITSELPQFVRSNSPVSELKIALNCGGSDSFSAITANPLLGLVSDLIVQREGTVALAEIPECHGVEGLLTARSKSLEVKKDLDSVFEWWCQYAARNNCSMNNNLAPGNIAGGITTIIEKSLGAVAKAGTTAITEVVGYGMPIRSHGAVLMNTPGFDPVSVTGLVAGGCNLVAFTTGQGSVFGNAVAPTIKIATNTALFNRMSRDMDFDAGRVLARGLSEEATRLYELMIATASGHRTASEELGMGWEEFVVWSVGETL